MLAPIFESVKRIDKTVAPRLAKEIDAIRSYASEIVLPTITPLSEVIADSLEEAVKQAENTGKTTAITAWKDKWFAKDGNNKFVMKQRINQIKLRSVVYVYDQYLAACKKLRFMTLMI